MERSGRTTGIPPRWARPYEFRVSAVDYKGNAQPWVTVPNTQARPLNGVFARVAADSLNVRTGAGVGFGVVKTVGTNDYIYVLDGPVSAGGYDWYRVQYGFTAWPAGGYATIGWVAAGSSVQTYLVPAPPPTRSRAAPFVTDLAVTDKFIPNGRAGENRAVASYQLAGAVDDARLGGARSGRYDGSVQSMAERRDPGARARRGTGARLAARRPRREATCCASWPPRREAQSTRLPPRNSARHSWTPGYPAALQPN